MHHNNFLSNYSKITDNATLPFRAMKFKNPIIPGFNPDPSICYHSDSETFILVTSSFHMFPGLPIYASKDLQNWTQIGNAINRLEQLDLSQADTTSHELGEGRGTMIATHGLWAPSIRYHPQTDKFYITCTNTYPSEHFQKRNFIISCPASSLLSPSPSPSSTTAPSNPHSPWSDPTPFSFNGIDPSPFFDPITLKTYIVGPHSYDSHTQPSCIMKIFEIDLSTGEHLSEEISLWEGHLKHDPEAPHIYYVDGYYYLLIADGGTFSRHSICIARSRELFGPYESCPSNPILTAWGPNQKSKVDGNDEVKEEEYIQNTGHGDLVQDAQGKWWCVHLGIRNESSGERVPLGRETFLTPVEWKRGEWPVIQQTKMTFSRETHVSPKPLGELLSPAKGVKYIYIRRPILQYYSWSKDFKSVDITASEADLTVDTGTTSFVGVRQADLACSISVTMKPVERHVGKDIVAGLVVYKDSWRFAGIQYDFKTGKIVLRIYNRAIGWDDVIERIAVDARKDLELKISATALDYTFFYRETGTKSWSKLGVLDSKEMTALDFTGTVFGIFANGRGDGMGCSVSFENFHQELST